MSPSTDSTAPLAKQLTAPPITQIPTLWSMTSPKITSLTTLTISSTKNQLLTTTTQPSSYPNISLTMPPTTLSTMHPTTNPNKPAFISRIQKPIITLLSKNKKNIASTFSNTIKFKRFSQRQTMSSTHHPLKSTFSIRNILQKKYATKSPDLTSITTTTRPLTITRMIATTRNALSTSTAIYHKVDNGTSMTTSPAVTMILSLITNSVCVFLIILVFVLIFATAIYLDNIKLKQSKTKNIKKSNNEKEN